MAAVISSQAGNRAPRATAASPARTPAPPRITAAHSAAYVAATGRWPASSSGGQPGGQGISGTAGLYLTAEAAIMIRSELPIPTAAAQARTRVSRAVAPVAA